MMATVGNLRDQLAQRNILGVCAPLFCAAWGEVPEARRDLSLEGSQGQLAEDIQRSELIPVERVDLRQAGEILGKVHTAICQAAAHGCVIGALQSTAAPPTAGRHGSRPV